MSLTRLCEDFNLQEEPLDTPKLPEVPPDIANPGCNATSMV